MDFLPFAVKTVNVMLNLSNVILNLSINQTTDDESADTSNIDNFK